MNYWLDEWAKIFVMAYFTPYFMAGNADLWKGITLNGIKGFNLCKPN